MGSVYPVFFAMGDPYFYDLAEKCIGLFDLFDKNVRCKVRIMGKPCMSYSYVRYLSFFTHKS